MRRSIRGGPTPGWPPPCEDDANQCIKVTEFPANDTSLTHPRWSANAYWSVGSWITSPVDLPGEIVCDAKYTLSFTYSWDAATNKGWRSYHNPAVCRRRGEDASGTQPVPSVQTSRPSPPAASPPLPT